MRIAQGTTFMGLRVRDDQRRKLEELARREEVTLTQIFRWALTDFLAKHFDPKDNRHD